MSTPVNDYDHFIAPIRQRMVNSIWGIVRDPDRTEDVLQETLLQLWEQMSRIRVHPNPTALILRVCVHRALDHVRRRNRRAAAQPYPAEEVIDRRSKAPPERLAERQRREEVLSAIGELPKRQAEALVLLAVEQLGYPEIARAMGCRESTVRVLVSKARRRLRARFGVSTSPSREESEIS